MWQVCEAACKDCGAPFRYSAAAYRLDVARGLSAPERCVDCRKKNATHIQRAGAAFWEAPKETDDSKRCWGKYGLGRLLRHRAEPEYKSYNGVPIDAPPEQFRQIAPVADALVRNLEDPHGTQVSILVGPTGTGKSTWVPYRMLRSRIVEHGRICVTQPRLLTLRQDRNRKGAQGTPGYIAKELLHAPPPYIGAGQEVGVRYRGEATQQDRYTRLLFATDGTVIHWITSGEIDQFAVLMIDEAHEQSTNMETMFALLRYKLPLYPKLRLVIASATVDIGRFQRYFGGGHPERVFLAQPASTTDAARAQVPTPAIDAEFASVDRSSPYPIYNRWPDGPDAFMELPGNFEQSTQGVPEAVARIVVNIRSMPGFTKLKNPFADVLVFVPTIPLVNRTVAAIRDRAKASGVSGAELLILPCHAQLDPDENEQLNTSELLRKNGQMPPGVRTWQRVIVATNYAETSVTFEGLGFVIDSGYTMDPVWDPDTCSTAYRPRWHTQAGARQRKGRVGRVQPGECFRLYTRATFKAQFREHPEPAIAREPLDMFLARAKAAGIDDLTTFEWLGKPDTSPKEIERAASALALRGAIDKDGDITNRGMELALLQTSTLDLALCVSEGDAFACALEVATFLAFLGQSGSAFQLNEKGVWQYNRWRGGCYDDLEFYLRLFHHWSTRVERDEKRSWITSNSVNASYFDAVAVAREHLLRQFAERTHTKQTERALDLERLHRARLLLARCVPESIYVRDAAALRADQFRPLQMGPDGRTGPPIALDRNSACLARPEIEAVLCMERTTQGAIVFGQHLVQLKRDWLTHLKSSPAAFAMFLKNAVSSDTGVPTGAAERIVRPPAVVKPRICAIGETVELRAIRPVQEEGSWMLCEDAKSAAPILVTLEGGTTFSPGTKFRGVVCRVDTDGGHITVDQGPFLKAYVRAGPVERRARIVRTVTQSDDKVRALICECEPGVTGRLDRTGVGRGRERKTFQKPIGETILVVVTGIVENERQLRLALPEVYRAQQVPQPQIQVGYRCSGYVTGFLKGKVAPFPRVGAFVELFPNGPEGFIHQSKILASALQAVQEGDEIRVEVIAVEQNAKGLRYSLRALP